MSRYQDIKNAAGAAQDAALPFVAGAHAAPGVGGGAARVARRVGHNKPPVRPQAERGGSGSVEVVPPRADPEHSVLP